MRRWLAVIASGVFVVGIASPANAADDAWSTHTQTVELIQYESLLVGVCAGIEVDATLTYQTYTHAIATIKNMTLSHPSMTVTTRTSCGRSGTPSKVSRMDFEMEWWDHQCHIKPSLGGSAGADGFSLAVGGTRDCSKVTAADRTSSYKTPTLPANWTHTQYNTNTKLIWPNSVQLNWQSVTKWCISVNASVVVYNQGNSDSSALQDQVCILWADAVH